ncbi:MAG: flagellar motor switch protein FliG [Pseudomonadota bacterium]
MAAEVETESEAVEESVPLSGQERAAAFLLMLGEREASEVLRHVEPEHIDTLATAMSTLPDLTPAQVHETVVDFCRQAGTASAVGANADAQRHIRKLLVMALGRDKANEITSRLSLWNQETGGIEALAKRDPKDIAELVRDEHPQVVATLLAYQDPRLGGQVLSLLPMDTRSDVVLRMATLEHVSVSAMEELNALVLDHLTNEDVGAAPSFTGGPKLAASVLNNLDMEVQQDILTSIKSHEADLGELIENSMFTFEDLMKIDDRSIQTLLAEVSSAILCTALKGCDDATKDKFLNNMSKRAADLLTDDMEARGPVKLSEVETAQREVVEATRRLIDAGTIVVAGFGGGEELVY